MIDLDGDAFTAGGGNQLGGFLDRFGPLVIGLLLACRARPVT
jgi:hypothetical protein